jgi:hypothetical protein
MQSHKKSHRIAENATMRYIIYNALPQNLQYFGD